ncbi:MAG: hypothetical protein ABI780_10065 [Ardenticatenales bacterium]
MNLLRHPTIGSPSDRVVRAKRAIHALAAASAVLAAAVLAVAATARPARTEPAASTSVAGSSMDDGPARIYLPRVARDVGSWPDDDLADRVWTALEAFEQRNPLASLVPNEATTPTIAAAAANVDAACHDFPDIPDVFGAGAHRDACQVWVPDAYGLSHAVRALRLVRGGRTLTDPDVVAEHRWGETYLRRATDAMERFVFRRCDPPNPFGHNETEVCWGYRDTRAAIWQNTQRASEIGVLLDVLRRTGPVDDDLLSKVDDVLVSTARAWRSAFWSTGRMPNTGIDFTTHTAAEAPAESLHGEPVAATSSITIHWDADKANTPAEEMAWMGAGVLVSMAVAGDRISATERTELVAAARHYVDYAISYNRPDPIFGVPVRTVGDEMSGGPYGQNRYWLENHQDDAPSLPYLGFAWTAIGLAHQTTDEPDGRPWPSFAPPEAWTVMARSAEATLIMPDGHSLVDLSAGGGGGFDVARYPRWTMPCGEHRPGALYVDTIGHGGGGDARFVSEIGHPAGLSILLAAVPLIHTALSVGDHTTAARWRGRLDAVLDEYIENPPGFAGVPCKVAPWVSYSPAYHWAYMINSYLYPWLQATGYRVGEAP